MKKGVPDEWQARQATQAILQVSSSKHNAKKITTRVRGPFHQSITAIITEEKREEKQFTKPTHVAVYLFRDLDRDRSRLSGNTKRAFKWSNLVRKARGCRVTLSAYFGQAPFSPKEKKKKTILTQHAVTGVHNLLCVKAAAVTTL